MRILMISDVYFPRINGVSTSTQTFRREFEKLGHEVTLIAPDYGDNGAPEHRTLRIPARRVILDPEDRMMRGGAVLRLTEQLRAQQFDIVHIQTPFVAHYAGVTLARRLGLPRVETYHTLFEEYLYNYIPFLPKSWLRLAARRFSSWQCNDVDAVIVPSTPMLETLHRYGIQEEGMEVIPTGMELKAFSGGDGARFRERHGIPPERPTLVHVGRVAFEKNIDFLLRVVHLVKPQLPGILLVIAGEGPALRHLRRLAADLGLEDNVLFVGYLARDGELLDCYCAGDAFIFASRTETQGLVLLEAMALGVPVVSTAVMGTKDILAPGKGALVAEDDIGDFAKQVLRVLRDRALRERLASEGRAYAATWSATALAERMVELYRAVVMRSRPTEAISAVHRAPGRR